MARLFEVKKVIGSASLSRGSRFRENQRIRFTNKWSKLFVIQIPGGKSFIARPWSFMGFFPNLNYAQVSPAPPGVVFRSPRLTTPDEFEAFFSDFVLPGDVSDEEKPRGKKFIVIDERRIETDSADRPVELKFKPQGGSEVTRTLLDTGQDGDIVFSRDLFPTGGTPGNALEFEECSLWMNGFPVSSPEDNNGNPEQFFDIAIPDEPDLVQVVKEIDSFFGKCKTAKDSLDILRGSVDPSLIQQMDHLEFFMNDILEENGASFTIDGIRFTDNQFMSLLKDIESYITEVYDGIPELEDIAVFLIKRKDQFPVLGANFNAEKMNEIIDMINALD